MDKNSHAVCSPHCAKTTSKKVQQNTKVREPMAQRTVLPKQTLHPNHRSIKVHHGQELTTCVFPPILQNPRPQQCNRTRKSESPWHKGQSSQNKPFPIQRPINIYTMDKNSHPVCFPHFAKTMSEPVQQNKNVRELMAQRTVLPKQLTRGAAPLFGAALVVSTMALVPVLSPTPGFCRSSIE